MDIHLYIERERESARAISVKITGSSRQGLPMQAGAHHAHWHCCGHGELRRLGSWCRAPKDRINIRILLPLTMCLGTRM